MFIFAMDNNWLITKLNIFFLNLTYPRKLAQHFQVPDLNMYRNKFRNPLRSVIYNSYVI